jgi:BTB/POZ domain-containing protein 10
MENVNEHNEGNNDDSSDSEIEALGLVGNVPLDIPPRDIPVRQIRALSDPPHSAMKHRSSQEERPPGPSSCMKRSSEVFDQIHSPRCINPQIGRPRPKDMDKLTLIVDGTRFVVERSLFIAHPNTMLGR